MALSDAERAEHARLDKEIRDEQEHLASMEKEKKEAEERKRAALADPKPGGNSDATVIASESSVAHLTEEMQRTQAMIELLMRERHVPETEIQEVKRRGFMGRRR